MLPKVRKSAKGCSKCKIVLQTQESVQKVLSAIGKGLSVVSTYIQSKIYTKMHKLLGDVTRRHKTLGIRTSLFPATPTG